MYRLNHRYHSTAPKGTISPTGVREIYKLIYAQNLERAPWKKLNPAHEGRYLFPLPDDWQWQWVVNEAGDYRGKFPKRVGQYYHKVHGLKAPPEFLEQVGNVARAHSETASEYVFDFVDRFDWQAGDFGDDGSCFWAENAGARDLLRENGAHAVRFYENGRGVARAWLAPIEAEGLYFVFNGYGFPGNPTLAIAQAVARFLGVRYRRVILANNGHDEGLLWINSGSGYVLGKHSRIIDLSYYDFNWPEPDKNF